MHTLSRPWFHDFLAPVCAPLDRAQFVAKYLPQYVRDYQPPTGIRLNKRGRCMMSTRASVSAQVTKRETRINQAFAAYQSDHAACYPVPPANSLSPVTEISAS